MQLDQLVLQDPQIGAFINEHFISKRLNGLKGEGEKFRKKYDIKSFPTVIFLNPRGEELDRMRGFENKESYTLILDYFLSGKWKGYAGNTEPYLQNYIEYRHGKNMIDHYQALLAHDSTNANTNFMLAMKHAMKREDAAAARYFHRVLALDPENRNGFKDEALFRLALHEAKNSKNIAPLQSLLQRTSIERFYEPGYSNLIRYYANNEGKNIDAWYAAYEEALTKMPHNADTMNGYAWTIYRNKSKEQYDRGIKLALIAVELKPTAANIWDTLAWLYLENGEKENAINAMKKAIELAPGVKEYKKNLKKIRKS